MENMEIPEHCQFCEVSVEIKFKCFNCELFLCKLCDKRIHAKIKAAEQHKSIDIQECADPAEAIRKVDLETMNCIHHDDKKCIMYCENCEEAICSVCVISGHKNHNLDELDEAYTKELSKLINSRHNIKQNLNFIDREETKLQQLLGKVSEHCTLIKDSIENRDKVMKESVQLKTNKLLDQLEDEWGPINKALDNDIWSIRETKDDLKQTKQTLDQTFQSRKATDVFHAFNSINKQLPTKDVTRKQFKSFQLIPIQTDFDELFGILYKLPHLKILSSYKSHLKIVTKLVKYNSSICVSSDLEGIVVQYRIENNTFEITNVLNNIHVSDMSLSKYKNILLSVDEDIKLLMSNGSLKTFASFGFGPLAAKSHEEGIDVQTLCVHQNDKKELFIGALAIHRGNTCAFGIIYILNKNGKEIYSCMREIHDKSEKDKNSSNSDSSDECKEINDEDGNSSICSDGSVEDGNEHDSSNEFRNENFLEWEGHVDDDWECYYSIIGNMSSVYSDSDKSNSDNDTKNINKNKNTESEVLTLPSRILNTKKDNILIVDTFSFIDNTGRLVLMNRNCQSKWIYNGCECEDCANIFPKFCPIDIAESLSGLILVTDIGCFSKLHVLNEKGQTLTCNFVGHLGISNPMSLFIEENGNMWIGCKSKDNNDDNIYCLEFN